MGRAQVQKAAGIPFSAQLQLAETCHVSGKAGVSEVNPTGRASRASHTGGEMDVDPSKQGSKRDLG